MSVKPECHICDKKFNTVQDLEEHLRKHHDEENTTKANQK
jgi:hypothetical protein